jgi:hypothetical protein
MSSRFEASPNTTVGQEVVDADDQRYAAMIGLDWPGLEATLHEELVYTHSSGDRDSKKSYLASVTAGRPVYHDVDIRERFVVEWGDVALLHGRVRIYIESRGSSNWYDILYQGGWVKEDGRWQMIAWSSTKFKESA